MAALKADGDKKAFLLGDFIRGQNTANSRAIHANRLFHENMKAIVHGMLEMDGAKAWGSGYGHEVDAMLHHFLICVETSEHGTFVDDDLFTVLLLKPIDGTLSLVDEGICHSNQLCVVGRIHDLGSGPCAATATPDQTDTYGFTFGLLALNDGGKANGGGSCHCGSSTNEFST